MGFVVVDFCRCCQRRQLTDVASKRQQALTTQRSVDCATAKGVDDDDDEADMLRVLTNRPTLIDTE